MFPFQNSRKKQNINNNNNEKIILNSITDLLKIPIYKLNHSKLEDFSGNYFDKIYQETINKENQQKEEENLTKSNVIINKPKSKKKVHKQKKIRNYQNNNNEIISPKKKKINIKENNLNNNFIIEKKEFYPEEIEEGLPEIDQEKNSEENDYDSNLKNNINLIENTISSKTGIKKSGKRKNKKLKDITSLSLQQNFNINNITPFPDNKQVYMYGQMVTPGNEDDNFYSRNNNYYMQTPTPTPNPFDQEIEDKKESPVYPLNKIIFSIDYNSLFGEEVCILGSSPKLGLWKLSDALHLKWNLGNIWTGEIDVEVEDLQDFEFKFVIIEKDKIKYWESGNNNIVNFTGLINEFQFNKIGRYNKYEYEYKQNEGTLLIKCHWRK